MLDRLVGREIHAGMLVAPAGQWETFISESSLGAFAIYSFGFWDVIVAVGDGFSIPKFPEVVYTLRGDGGAESGGKGVLICAV